jgi:hypothetical protein
MSQPGDPRAGDDDPRDRQPKIVVDDPEDFAKTRQLRAIFDARDDYIDARREANREMERGKIDFADRNRRVFRYLQDLAMTMEPLLKSYDAGREIWDENVYGVDAAFCSEGDIPSFQTAKRGLESELTELPAEGKGTKGGQLLTKYENKKNSVGWENLSIKSTKADIRAHQTSWGWQVQGLGTLIEKTHRLTYRASDSRDPFQTTPPTQQICDAAFRDLQDFLRQIGLGVQFDQEQQTKIDDELLEEVDEWRRQNV